MSGARQKLNSAVLVACVLVAGAAGLLVQDWRIFWMLLCVFVGACWTSGLIRIRFGR
ncbi:MAG TPA: hypothetical protein VGN57_10790 [Pirellulaceae bacterium]|nr:hypothetical protein [Pirellulaceae bacterium]